MIDIGVAGRRMDETLFQERFLEDGHMRLKQSNSGRMAERLNAAVSKTVLPVLPVTRVQIPLLPPDFQSFVPTIRLFCAFTRCMIQMYISDIILRSKP